MRFAASDVLDVQPREIRCTFKINAQFIDVIMYDAVSGGAGYAVRISKEIPVAKLLRSAIRRLECPNDCAGGCRACLCDYSNQRVWDSFDRHSVLNWLKGLDQIGADHPLIRLGAEPWENPSYEMLEKTLKPFVQIHLVGQTLFGGKPEEIEQARMWLLNRLNAGCKVNMHLWEPLKLDIKKLLPFQRKTISYLRSYVEDGRLLIDSFLDKDTNEEHLVRSLRIFTAPAEGGFIWFTDYSASPILEEILPKPAYQMTADKRWGAILADLTSSSSPCSKDVFKEAAEIKRWELLAGEKRDFEEYFAPIANAYVEELYIMDPYCAAGDENRNQLLRFFNAISALAGEVKSVKVLCKELNYKARNYESPVEVRKKIQEMSKGVKVEKLESIVYPFATAKSFHDRYVAFKVIDASGESSRHVFDLSGGIDFLMNEKVGTKIHYFVE
ncbi:MAG TPA: DUF1998 domain-containing protein [Syntrophobacteraceae bacterium]|nr:DUF1998 domain-containing protein [Syntrophobacteraceae bacterium]